MSLERTATLKELKVINAALEAKVATLEARNAYLEAENSRLRCSQAEAIKQSLQAECNDSQGITVSLEHAAQAIGRVVPTFAYGSS